MSELEQLPGGLRRRRITLLFLLAGVVPLIAVAAMTTSAASNAVGDQINDRISAAARQTTAFVSQLLQSRAGQLAAFAGRPGISAALSGTAAPGKAALQSDMDAILAEESFTSQAELVAADGTVLGTSGSHDSTIDFAPQWSTLLQQAPHHLLVLSTAHRGSSTWVTLVVAATPSGSSATGFLVAVENLDAATSSLLTFAEAQDMAIDVVDSSGGLIIGVHTDANGHGQIDATWTATASKRQALASVLSSGGVQFDTSTSDSLTALSRVADAPWAVSASIDARTALAPLGDVRIAVWSVTVALCLLFLAGVHLLNRALKHQQESEMELMLQAVALEHVAMHDHLTGLPNRVLFNDRLQQALITARRQRTSVALFILDLNGFKAINDTLGHEAGDRMIKLSAERLVESVRANDTVARLGGDEFAIIGIDAGVEGAAVVAQKIRARFDEPLIIDGRPVQAGISAGWAIFPDDGYDGAALLRRADANMYADKRARKRAALGSAEPPRGPDGGANPDATGGPAPARTG